MPTLSVASKLEQSPVRGLVTKLITSGRTTTFSCAFAVCLTDPVVNPHSYIPAENKEISYIYRSDQTFFSNK